MERIAIIGAGVAGLWLGRRLQTKGFTVELFDKARGPSGRIATRRLDFGRFDHGAQYFTARHPTFVAQVQDWTARGVVAPWTGRVVALEAGVIREEAAPAQRYVGVPSMSAIARDLSTGLAVEAGVRMASARRVGKRWQLVDENGFERPGFDRLVSAVPAPQAPPFLTSSTEFMLHAQRATFAPCHAAMIQFEEPVPAAFDAAFVKASPLGWVAREASKPGREASNGWVLHSTPEWSLEHVDRPADQVLEVLRAAFAAQLGGKLPASRGGAVHRWLYARATNPIPGACLWDSESGLGVCGDWLHGDRIEDAFLSADRLAEAILESADRPRAA